jgi:hypothetical protein
VLHSRYEDLIFLELFQLYNNRVWNLWHYDRLCGLVVRVSGYRSRGSGSIPGPTRFSEQKGVWNGVHSASWGQLRSYLNEKVAAQV